MRKKKGFTLIELLIVVAIIAILALIAVPNFLESQVRSKVSRVKSEFRSIATAIEAYATDHNLVPRQIHTDWYPHIDLLAYPPSEYPNGVRGILWWGLSTPIAYITTVNYVDPFQATDFQKERLDEQRYTYQDMKTYVEKNPTSTFWPAAYEYYGAWRLGSVGPDKRYGHGFPNSAQLAYDPTNGTVSLGNIWRSQKLSEDKQPPTGVLLPDH